MAGTIGLALGNDRFVSVQQHEGDGLFGAVPEAIAIGPTQG